MMHILLIRDGHGSSSYTITSRMIKMAAAFTLSIMLLCFIGGVFTNNMYNSYKLNDIEETIAAQQEELLDIKSSTIYDTQALITKVAEIQYQLNMLNSIGDVVKKEFGVEGKSFNFTPLSLAEPLLKDNINALQEKMHETSEQFNLLLGIINNNDIIASSVPNIQRNKISSNYGVRRHPISGRVKTHTGIDLPAREGSPVKAPADGLVVFAGWVDGYGNVVDLDHGNGYSTRMAHHSKNLVKTGDLVKSNDIIAKVGSTGYSTGPHLHIEVKFNGKYMNPIAYMASR